MFINHVEIWFGTLDNCISFYIHADLYKELDLTFKSDKIKQVMRKGWDFRLVRDKGVFVIVDPKRPLLGPKENELS